MKKYILILIFATGVSATANSNWGRTICENNHGQVTEFDMQLSLVLKIEICLLGQSLIELDTLDKARFNSFGGPEANRAYRETRIYDFAACEKNYGRVRRGKDKQTARIYNICEFADRSWIGSDTLKDGMTSPWNRELNQALGIF